ncbi:MAG: glycosyltransferase family 2 protein [Sphingobacterium sp.]|jgi:GT2 family glycosyltransferase|nr:glycosyltransferase family 2 protein [Sphingobacterium sp.]
MKNVAVLMTVFNRIEKTILCLRSLFNAPFQGTELSYTVFLTDDGSTDGTTAKIKAEFPAADIEILPGNGQLFWNGGMNNSWRAAITRGGFVGYLWLNNDCIVLPNLWDELIGANEYSIKKFGKGGIYVGSTYNKEGTGLSYGGFNFVSKWTLKDEFLIPNGSFQKCQAAHGNITFVSHDVVAKEGIFCENYIHSGGDHDYSYRAYKHGHPVFILREYVGICENDHLKGDDTVFQELSLRERFRYLKSPLGYNLYNSLIFQQRCFPYRYVPVWLAGYTRALFPSFYYKVYRLLRR